MDKIVVIYLHGFLSSPQSQKACQTRDYVKQHYPNVVFEVPALDNHPKPAIARIEGIIQRYPGKQFRFVGSSLGGYLASYMMEEHGGKAVIINPAVKPFELLSDYIGKHVNPYTNVAFELAENHISDLILFDTPHITCPQNYWVLLQTGDETLDYRQAEVKYQGAKMTIEQGGDHSFQHFERFLPEIFRFLLQE